MRFQHKEDGCCMPYALMPANTSYVIGDHHLEYAMPPIGGSGKLEVVSNLEFHNSNLILL
jgi:hypothetical protein